MYSLFAKRLIQAPPKLVWEVISDIEKYADYAPNLSKVHKISEGSTRARRCYDKAGRGWDEACILWEEGKRYAYVIDTSDYPYPFIQVKGTWGLEPTIQGTTVYMRFDYTPKLPLFGWLTHHKVKQSFEPIVKKLLENWEAEILSRQQKV